MATDQIPSRLASITHAPVCQFAHPAQALTGISERYIPRKHCLFYRRHVVHDICERYCSSMLCAKTRFNRCCVEDLSWLVSKPLVSAWHERNLSNTPTFVGLYFTRNVRF
jgi:hypothetical protein